MKLLKGNKLKRVSKYLFTALMLVVAFGSIWKTAQAAIALSVTQGGTGAVTLTGILKGNGTSPITGIALPNDATKYLDGTGAFSTPSGGGTSVTSVTGTTNRITSTGGTTPVIDISASYIGQSSITTLGTIATGVWNGTAIGDSYISSASTWNAKESALTFSAPLSRSTNTISIPSSSASVNGYLSSTDWSTFNNKESALTFSSGLTRTTNTITDNLITGLSGGQTVIGGTGASENLTLTSTSNATKGFIYLGAAQTSGFDGTNSRLGILSAVPTNSLTIGSTGSGIALFNTSDQTTNFERMLMQWSSNQFNIVAQPGGTGVQRIINIQSVSSAGSGTALQFGGGTSTSGQVKVTRTTSGTGFYLFSIEGTNTGSSGIVTYQAINPGITQTGSAGYNMLLINPTENSTGSGVKRLISAQVGGTDKFVVDNTGVATVAAVGTAAGSLVSVDGTQTLTNKTLTSPIFSTISNTGTLTLPTSSDTLVGRATTDTLTNKRVTKRVVSMTDATSITPTGDTADINTQANTQATGTLTVNAPSGTPTDGQQLILRIKSTNVQTFSWNAIYLASNDITLPTASTGSGKYDLIGFMYNSDNSKWMLVSKSLGY